MDGMKTRQKIVTVGVGVLILVTLLVNTVVFSKRVRTSIHNKDNQQTVKADDNKDTSQNDKNKTVGKTSKSTKKTTEKSTTDKSTKDDKNSSAKDDIIMTVVDPDKPMVAFTFDDGPYSPVTDRIVAAFEKAGGNCTFFNVGERWEAAYTDYIASGKNAVAKGNEIATHSYNHPDLTTLSEDAIKNQVKKSSKLMEQNTGKEIKLLRPPGGAINEKVSNSVGKPMILWSVDSQDWRTRDTDAICSTVLDQIQDGSVILMHDLYETTAKAVERLLPKLKKQGYQFVTVSDLFEYRDVTLEAGGTYGNNTVVNPQKTESNSNEGENSSGGDSASDDYINYDDDEDSSEA